MERTLKSTCKEKGITLSALAKEVKCSPHYLSQLSAGLRRPSIDLALRIEDATKRRWKCQDWRRPEAE